MKDFLSRNGHNREPKESEDEPPVEEEIPPQAGRKAWGRLQGKPQAGLTLFSVKGNFRVPAYINYLDMAGGGSDLTIYFSHITVKITGKGLDKLADGIRRQVVLYIQEQHVSEFLAGQEAHWVKSIMIKKAAEAEELGKWNG